MHLIFFDEAKNDPDYPRYHLGAVCLEESVLGAIEEKINALAEKAFGTSKLSTDTEFHAAEIYHRKKNFKDWKDVGERFALIAQFVDILSMDEVDLIDIQINCDKLYPGQSAQDIGFMYLCERANDFMLAQKALGMLIGDRESDHHAARFASTLSKYRIEGTDFAYGQEITNLVDSVHFTHSHLSRFLQLADVYVWLSQFKRRNRSSGADRHKGIFELLQRQHVNLFPRKYKEWPK
jgi:hypothetical protein